MLKNLEEQNENQITKTKKSKEEEIIESQEQKYFGDSC